MGFDKIRSKIELITNNGTKHTRWADENYRGGPLNPLSNIDLEEKFNDASFGQISDQQKADFLEKLWNIEQLDNACSILDPFVNKIKGLIIKLKLIKAMFYSINLI